MMAGQARQITLRKLEVAVLSHGAFQAQRNGFCALLSDVLACYLSFTHASRLQDFIPLPTELIEHDRVFYAGHPLSEKPTRIQHHSAATPIDSVLYPLHRFPVLFATNTGTFEYFQAQHLFVYYF